MARIARARKGETIDELTERLFRAADPKTGMKAAAERLVAANRHLSLKGRGRARALEDDAFVVVPEVEGAEHDRRAVVPLGKAAARVLLKRKKEAVDALGPALEQSHDSAVTEVKAMLELADSEPLQAAAKEDDELAGRLEGIRERAMLRLEELERAREHRRVALERAEQTITELLERAAET